VARLEVFGVGRTAGAVDLGAGEEDGGGLTPVIEENIFSAVARMIEGFSAGVGVGVGRDPPKLTVSRACGGTGIKPSAAPKEEGLSAGVGCGVGTTVPCGIVAGSAGKVVGGISTEAGWKVGGCCVCGVVKSTASPVAAT